MSLNRYYIEGNTYPIKDDLKAYGCTFDGDKKSWVTKSIEFNGITYKKIKSLVDAVGADMYAMVLQGQAKTIQDILHKERR